MLDFIRAFSELPLLGQQLLVSASINFCSFLALPECSAMNNSLGVSNSCIAFHQTFLLIWWLNLIVCSLSLMLSFDHRHSVIRSLVVFILTVWEFSFCNESIRETKTLLAPLFVIFFRTIIFNLLLLDVMLDEEFRHSMRSVYYHMTEEFAISFCDFFENYINVVENVPGFWQFTEAICEISKCVQCSSI